MILQPHRLFIGLNQAEKLFGVPRGAGVHKKECTDCMEWIALYRTCPYDKCTTELGYCKAHGGDVRAQEEMVIHIQTHLQTKTS